MLLMLDLWCNTPHSYYSIACYLIMVDPILAYTDLFYYYIRADP